MSEIDYAAALRAGDAVRGTTSPNPPVGCALFSPDGALIATGGTSPAGGAHAEINALRAAGDRARGATAVVTLEPCNHTGRTGPCSQALVDAHITRLVYLTKDPNPQAAGGADYLERHGVEVIYALQRVDALQPWLTSVARGRPSVTLKYAASLDGLTAAPDGTSKWITGDEAREQAGGEDQKHGGGRHSWQSTTPARHANARVRSYVRLGCLCCYRPTATRATARGRCRAVCAGWRCRSARCARCGRLPPRPPQVR